MPASVRPKFGKQWAMMAVAVICPLASNVAWEKVTATLTVKAKVASGVSSVVNGEITINAAVNRILLHL